MYSLQNLPPPYNPTRFVGLCLIAGLLSGGCRPNGLDQPDAQPTSLARVAADQIAYRVSYDLETLTRRKLPDGTKATAFDLVEAMPSTRRMRIDLVIQQDGSVSYTSEKLTPEQQIGPQQYPDKLAKTVMANGMASFYDGSGKLCRTTGYAVAKFQTFFGRDESGQKNEEESKSGQFDAGWTGC